MQQEEATRLSCLILTKTPLNDVVARMASPTDIRKGRVILYQGSPHLVLDVQHRTPGRRAGFVQVIIRNLSTGSSTATKFLSSDTVEFCHMDVRKLEFSYEEDLVCHFMDTNSYEDIVLSKELIEDQRQYMVLNKLYDVLFVDDKAVRVQLPAALEMKVIESPEGVRGDSASNVQKPAVTETGLTVQVPLFIKPGEVIRVNTEDGTYLGRA